MEDQKHPLVIGIDLGSSDSYVGYVTKGVVDIVQNEVSMRKTPTLVGFTSKERLLGDAALSQIKSNTLNTCRNFKHLLGERFGSLGAEPERFWSTSALAESADGGTGFSVKFKEEMKIFSAVEVTAMFLTKLKAITAAWCVGEVSDAVIAVPSYFTDVHRKALLDAAHISGLNVLRVMNEHAATALGYGIYREFDDAKPTTVAFCTMGHVVFSVAIVQFIRGKLTVLCEKSAKVGGRDMDECLIRIFAQQFQRKVGCDPLSNKKPQFKLEDAVTKTKKILSANSDASISVECLMEDTDFSGTITRDDFLEMCKPMMQKVNDVLESAKAMCGLPVAEIDSVEMCGGASRVPWVKEMCSKAFGGKELSTTMNADECVARGCTVQAAILSKHYKVRDFKVEDISSFAVNLSFLTPQLNGDIPSPKSSVVFAAKSAMHLMKLVSFQRKEPFELTLSYSDPTALPSGTPTEIGRYLVEMPKQEIPKKVKVKLFLSVHGTYTVSGAQLLEEEGGEENAPPPPSGKPDGDAAKQQDGDVVVSGEKRKDSVEITESKPRKKYKRTELSIKASSPFGLSEEQLKVARDREEAMKAETREIEAIGAMRNDLEAYILDMRSGVAMDAKYGPFVPPGGHEQLHQIFSKAEDWLYDQATDDKQVYMDKLAELKIMGSPIQYRFREHKRRQELVAALRSAGQPSARTDGKRLGDSASGAMALRALEAARSESLAWLAAKEAEQALLPTHIDPVLVCADLDNHIQNLSRLSAACEPDDDAVVDGHDVEAMAVD